jgi:hypothetical protein
VALLVATIFWSWVWGPVGLVLSVPLTVMLAVLGKYVRPLEPLWILLGDHPPLPPDVQLYQRLLAGDSEEAAEVVEEFARTHTPLEICDQLLVPMLAMAKRDRGRGEMGEPLQSAVWATTQQLLDEYGEPPTSGDDDVEVNEERKVRVVGVPAADHGDELAIEMLRRAAPPIVDFQVVPLVTLASELIEILIDAPAQAVCIAALGPGGVGQTRYLCKRIRQHFPEVRIIVCRCGYQGEVAKMAASLQARGASQVTTSLHEVVDVLQRTQPLVATAAVAR